MVIQTWVFAQHFLGNEQREPVALKEATGIFVTN